MFFVLFVIYLNLYHLFVCFFFNSIRHLQTIEIETRFFGGFRKYHDISECNLIKLSWWNYFESVYESNLLKILSHKVYRFKKGRECPQTESFIRVHCIMNVALGFIVKSTFV